MFQTTNKDDENWLILTNQDDENWLIFWPRMVNTGDLTNKTGDLTTRQSYLTNETGDGTIFKQSSGWFNHEPQGFNQQASIREISPPKDVDFIWKLWLYSATKIGNWVKLYELYEFQGKLGNLPNLMVEHNFHQDNCHSGVQLPQPQTHGCKVNWIDSATIWQRKNAETKKDRSISIKDMYAVVCLKWGSSIF